MKISIVLTIYISTVLPAVHSAVWKFQDYSVIQILREINFGQYKSYKTEFFAIFETLNLISLVIVSLPQVQILIKSKFRASKCDKMADFAGLKSSKFDFT